MNRPQRESCVIQVGVTETLKPNHQTRVSPKFNFSAMKLFDRFRKILWRFLFSLPPRESPGTMGYSAPRRRSCDRPDPPKTSCSSYYSSSSHYNEAIADCIEFLNRSSQDGVFSDGKSSVIV